MLTEADKHTCNITSWLSATLWSFMRHGGGSWSFSTNVLMTRSVSSTRLSTWTWSRSHRLMSSRDPVSATDPGESNWAVSSWHRPLHRHDPISCHGLLHLWIQWANYIVSDLFFFPIHLCCYQCLTIYYQLDMKYLFLKKKCKLDYDTINFSISLLSITVKSDHNNHHQ